MDNSTNIIVIMGNCKNVQQKTEIGKCCLKNSGREIGLQCK